MAKPLLRQVLGTAGTMLQQSSRSVKVSLNVTAALAQCRTAAKQSLARLKHAGPANGMVEKIDLAVPESERTRAADVHRRLKQDYLAFVTELARRLA